MNSPAVQSINHISGNIDTYLFISFVQMDSITILWVSLCNQKSLLNSSILSCMESENGSLIQLPPFGLPFVPQTIPAH